MTEKKSFNWNGVLVLPVLLLTGMVLVIPALMTIFASFTNWNGLSFDVDFVAWDNYAKILTDSVFLGAIGNVLEWILMFITIPVFLGLLSSALLLRKRKSRMVYQVIYLIPYILSSVVICMIFLNVIYNQRTGMIGLLRDWGWDISNPLSNMNTSLQAAAAADIWHYWGYLSIIYLAAFRQTPEDQVEAAQIDGCNAWRLFWYIYMPSIRSTFILTFIMLIIGCFLSYDYVKMLTEGGPANSSMVIALYANTMSFNTFQFGIGSAAAVVMAFFGIVASLFYIRISRSENNN